MGDKTSIWTDYGKSLVWQPYNHTWNLDSVVNSQTKTDGWIWPVIDYGFFDATDFTKPIDVRNLRPGFFIKTAVELLLQSAGYKGAGSLLKDPLYPLLICQFANGSFEHGTDYQADVGRRGFIGHTDQISRVWYNTPNHDGYIDFNIDSDPSHLYLPSSSGYFAKEPTDTTILFSYSLQFTTTNKSADKGSTKLQIAIALFDLNNPAVDGIRIASITHDFAPHGEADVLFFKNQKISIDHLFQPGENIKIIYSFQGHDGGSFIMDAGATLTITEKYNKYNLARKYNANAFSLTSRKRTF